MSSIGGFSTTSAYTAAKAAASRKIEKKPLVTFTLADVDKIAGGKTRLLAQC